MKALRQRAEEVAKTLEEARQNRKAMQATLEEMRASLAQLDEKDDLTEVEHKKERDLKRRLNRAELAQAGFDAEIVSGEKVQADILAEARAAAAKVLWATALKKEAAIIKDALAFNQSLESRLADLRADVSTVNVFEGKALMERQGPDAWHTRRETKLTNQPLLSALRVLAKLLEFVGLPEPKPSPPRAEILNNPFLVLGEDDE